MGNENAARWSERIAFAGFDWAGDHHDVVVVDVGGTVVEDFRIDDSAAGWQQLRKRLSAYADLAVAVETRSGVVVERLLEAGYAVFPVNPMAAKRYRERKAPSGHKTDRVDAWSMADALRTDGHAWRALRPDDPLTVELRVLCRDEVALIGQRTALVHQLQAALREYYPVALRAFEDWTMRSSWAFVERFPTPAALIQSGKRRWEKFLHTQKLYRPETYAERLRLFATAEEFCGSVALIQAKSLLATGLAIQLRTLQDHLDRYRARIEELFARHPDHDLFGSLPGVGPKLGPRLLSELGDDRGRFDSAEGLQCYVGTAPVTHQSGKMRTARFRRGCNPRLRHAVHLWAGQSLRVCAWAQVYYEKKRSEGKSYACALRCLAQRWLKILWKMWQTRTRYDAERHHRNQVRHGGWVLALRPVKS
ncbi:MAG: IS110 family transposase [Phycisphaerales bacterium]|nr:IS110 family transposase [Phycisphaerales bacterium]